MNHARKFFQRHPRIANSLSGSVIFGSGDLIAQEIERAVDGKEASIDEFRILRTAALGGVMNGLFLYQWYRLLDASVGSSMTNKRGVLLKMLADQVVFAPFAIVVFFAASCVRPSKRVEETVEAAKIKIEKNFLSTYLADWMFWPFANYVNFSFVSLHFRPTFIGFAQLIWQTYLSWVTNHRHREDNVVAVDVVAKESI